MNMVVRKCLTIFSISVLIFAVGATSVFAEDIEIYTGNSTNANVLFILDQSESMLQLVGSTGKTRDQVAKEAFQAVMSQSYQNLNVGFMDYGRDNGAGVDLPVVDINQPAKNVEPGVVSTTETYASMISRFANNLEGPQPNAKTALVEALLEAAKYYRGDVIDNLSQGIGTQGTWDDGQSRYTGGSWRAAGPRTLTTGGSSPVAGSYCHTASSPAGAPYSQCNNIFPGSCQNKSATSTVTHQHGTYCPVSQVCTQYDVTGTECIAYGCPVAQLPNPPHTHNGYPAYTRCKETSSTTAKTYISPIQSSCDRNFIVLLSDGGPTILGSHEQTSIQGFANNAGLTPPRPPCEDLAAAGFTDPSILSKGLCGPDLVKAINTSDVITSIPGSIVTTHTIGFQLGGAPQAQSYLQKLAVDGGGQFFDADSGDPTQLVTIIQTLLAGLSTKARTISTPITTIDLGNPLTTRKEIYYSQFAGRNSPRWNGNVKGYYLGPKTTTPVDPTIAIRDLNEDIATDANGDFVTSARSFWTSGNDGNDVTLGGFAAKLNPSSRTLYTDDGASSSPAFINLVASTFDETDLALFNLASTGNATNDHTMVDQLVEWARGVDVDDENGNGNFADARAAAGDSLHPVPIVAQYASGPARVLYTMTNEGYIHAIDVSTNGTSGTGGDEIFAYMPSDLLSNLDPLRRNTFNNPKIYGLDGPLTFFQPNGILDTAGSKYLYFGMRRGGKNYYSLDVSDTSSPSLRWVIEGGSGSFAELAQTWSKSTPAKIHTTSTTVKDVLVFGGGYDVDQDANTLRTADDEGRAVFIVDASDGSLLWSAGPDNSHDLNLGLSNSIPGGIAAIDLNADGIQDRLYFGDTGGRIWRVDLDTTLANSTGYMLADLASDGVTNPVHNRRFYTEPSVTRLANGKLGITIGSGYRAHPLSSVVAERTYMIYDPNAAIGDIPSSPVAKIDGTGANAVEDITSNFTFNPNATSANVNGWKIEWPVGTKVMADIDVIEGKLHFSLYEPPTTTSSCLGAIGRSAQFVLDINGRPIDQQSSFYTTSGNTVFDSASYVDNILWGGVSLYSPGSGLGGIGFLDGTMPTQPNTLDPLKTRFWLNLDTLTP